jgi:hypothetical protein
MPKAMQANCVMNSRSRSAILKGSVKVLSSLFVSWR